jgi:hypothetical protein
MSVEIRYWSAQRAQMRAARHQRNLLDLWVPRSTPCPFCAIPQKLLGRGLKRLTHVQDSRYGAAIVHAHGSQYCDVRLKSVG